MDNQQIKWSENVILVDGDFIDKVAFDLIVNFERIIGRRIPQADIARWIDCIAMDGGLRPGLHQTQVVLVHNKQNAQMENFTPGNYDKDLNGKAFKDNLGEFTISSFPVEKIVKKEDFLADILQTVTDKEEVKRVMVVTNEECYQLMAQVLHYVDDDSKRITLFAMQPMPGGNFRQEILGYSLMSALGIKSEEIKTE